MANNPEPYERIGTAAPDAASEQPRSSMTLGNLIQICTRLLQVNLHYTQAIPPELAQQLAAVDAGLTTAINTYPHLQDQLLPYLQKTQIKRQQIIEIQQLQQHPHRESITTPYSASPLLSTVSSATPLLSSSNNSSPHTTQTLPLAIDLADRTRTQYPSGDGLINTLIFHHPGNRYEKIRKLRDSLFGHVLLCRDHTNGDLVAVKLSKKELIAKRVTSKGKAVNESPLDELKFMRQLNTPMPHLSEDIERGRKHVLRLVDECDDGVNIWTVLEFCSEGEMFDYVQQRDGHLDPRLVARFFSQMVAGVRSMHARGVCHLDLSLENLLLTGDPSAPHVKICDFGLARFIEYYEMPDGSLVEKNFPPATGTKPGKLGYLSPEIFASLPFYGTLCDVWSMGIILFILLTGVPPYEMPAVSDGRFAMIMDPRQGVTMLLKRWNMLSKVPVDALDLLAKMLQPPSLRISIDKIAHHPYVLQSNLNRTYVALS